MPVIEKYFDIPETLVLGQRPNERVPLVEQKRQRKEAIDILGRLAHQPGVVLADEVGMGKTFVALAVAYCVGLQSRKRPVVVMVPPNLIDKWEQDLDAFLDFFLQSIIKILMHLLDEFVIGQFAQDDVVFFARHALDLSWIAPGA